MHRPTVGIIALVSLAAWLALWFLDVNWDGKEVWWGALLRVGAVLGAIWLAMPQIRRLPAWIAQASLVAVVVIAVRPRLALIAIPLLLAYLVLRPRRRGARTSRPTRAANESAEKDVKNFTRGTDEP